MTYVTTVFLFCMFTHLWHGWWMKHLGTYSSVLMGHTQPDRNIVKVVGTARSNLDEKYRKVCIQGLK